MNKYSLSDTNQKAFSDWFASISFAVKKELAEQVTADQPAADLSDSLCAFLVHSGQDANWLNALVDNLWEFSNGFGIDDEQIKLTPIGNVDQYTGSDAYMLLTRLDDDITPEQAHNWLLPRVYRDTSHPGGVFCHTILVSPYPDSTNKVVCIVQYRRDI